MPPSPIFADRILTITVTGPLVRLDLGSLRPQGDEEQKTQLLATDTLVMPIDGFLASLGMIDKVVKKLMADGVIKARPVTTEVATDSGSSASRS